MKPEKPITRKEMYLDVATGGSTELPSPVTREEKYLAKIAGESVDIPTPVTRYEMLLAAVAGESYTLTPVTRLEIYLAKAAGQDVDVPQPITREEMYWFDYVSTPSEKEYTGAVPVIFTANGQPLLDYLISGNTVQSGTPTPDSPIMPEGCGDLETSETKAGQYKIPISSASTTTPVYLGEVETTRRIRKLVLTGEESWDLVSGNAPYRLLLSKLMTTTNKSDVFFICSHFRALSNIAEWSPYSSCMSVGFSGRTSIKGLQFRYTTVSSLDGFKAYLAAQYAAGTPVTVWYVLATPETAVVNEPLMRIGDYADTLSMGQAGVQIPTANGSTTLDVETTVPPSEVYIKYRGDAVATLSALSTQVSNPEATTEEENPEEMEETENGSEDVSLQHEFEAIE